MIVYCR